MTAHRSPGGRPPWRLLGLLVLLAGAGMPGAASAAARPSAAGDLRGVTTITWSGVAGFRLRLPHPVEIPEQAMRLVPKGATYAFVRMVDSPQPAGCTTTGIRVCKVAALTWLADLAGGHGHVAPRPADPGRDHLTVVSDPPRIDAPYWDLYLFTDGTATMEIRLPGVPGRAAYVASGRVRGRAARLPVTCPPVPCDPAKGVAGAHAYGGASFDVGTLGYVMSIAYTDKRPAWTGGIGHNQPIQARACAYPNQFDPAASRDPAAHPFGCDPVPEHPTAPGEWLFTAGNELNGGSGKYMTFGDYEARGLTYAGYRAGTVDLYPAAIGGTTSRYGGYGIWFSYGIR